MGNIVLLDELTINKIAAGEVIERPASVVKELVENSIDAGANKITIETKNGGISYIRITDNGKGFLPDDMEIAFERHATSKIREAADLETVTSMGFRGEALASIAAISHVELISKTAENEIGKKIEVKGGNIINIEDAGCPQGTTITVTDLFYNTPVRYKFLKKDFTEAGYIEDAVTRIALVHPEIAIKLVNSGKVILQTSGNGDMKSVIYSIYGKDVAENVIDVNYTYEDLKITGVVGKPVIARSNRANQLFFVNKRYIKDKILTSAAEQGYKGLLTIGKYGFLVLNMEMNPKKHPMKRRTFLWCFLWCCTSLLYAQPPKGDFGGSIPTPQGELPIIFHFGQPSGAPHVTMDSPSQGISGFPVQKTHYSSDGQFNIGMPSCRNPSRQTPSAPEACPT